MSAHRLRATVSLDLDDLWTYLKTRGDSRWTGYPSYLPVFLPRVLALLDKLKLRITFFIVGRDAAVPANVELIQAITSCGHEIGNHSYEHDCWLHRYRRSELDAELERAEVAIEQATGRRPRGFRGPGYTWSPELLECLQARGYHYDASTLPTIIGPLARMYFLRTAPLSAEQKRERGELFGSFRDAVRSVRPYLWRLPEGRTLLEIPVTPMPVTRLPFHLSYLLYLDSYSPRLMEAYLGMALALCRGSRVEPSFLLHPLDLLGPAEAPGLEFFPAMRVSAERKAAVFQYVLQRLQREFDLVTLESFADDPAGRTALQLRDTSRSYDGASRHGPEVGTVLRPRRTHAPRLESPESPFKDSEVYRET